uniref:Uncharacterized protein n=1 Tax=Globodera rostochiensis TaxID=31243 RepID=A0A914H4U0_GLORO
MNFAYYNTKFPLYKRGRQQEAGSEGCLEAGEVDGVGRETTALHFPSSAQYALGLYRINKFSSGKSRLDKKYGKAKLQRKEATQMASLYSGRHFRISWTKARIYEEIQCSERTQQHGEEREYDLPARRQSVRKFDWRQLSHIRHLVNAAVIFVLRTLAHYVSRVAMENEPPVKEILWPPHGHVYEQEFMLPAYCKPKLIPLKSVTLEKLEKMQAENAEKLHKLEQEREAEEAKFKNCEHSDAVGGQARPDIWRADE